MPVAHLDKGIRKDGLKAILAEGVRGSAASEVRRKTKSIQTCQKL